MVTISIVYHSGYGHTKRMAESVRAGAAHVEGVTANLIAIGADGELPDDGFDAIAASDGVIFGSPTYMGGPSWQFKKFADASSKPWYGQVWKDKVAAGFTNSASMNGDKLSTLHYFFTLAMQHSMLWVGTGMKSANAKSATRDDLNYLGSFSGAMASTPSDASVEEMLSGDLATAEAFGARVAETTLRFAKT